MEKNYRQPLVLAVLMLAIMPGWSLEWKKSLPGENRKSLLKSIEKISEDGWVNILTEDFSKCVAGSEERRDSVMLQDDVYEIPEEFTHSTWWSGYGLYQAGGCLAVDAPGYGGFLNTPEIPMKGLVRVSARIKALGDICPVTMVLNRGGIETPKQVAPEERSRCYDFDGWESVSYTFYNPYEEDVFVQFNRLHYSAEKHGFLIDDICIDVLPAYIPAVSEIACGEFVNDGFGVRWVNSPFTNTYLVSLYEETATGDADHVLKEDFNSWIADENGKLIDFPEGWTIQLRDFHPSLIETESGNSLVFGRLDETIEIPSYGGRIYELKLSFTNFLGDDPQAWGTSAYLWGWNGANWCYITDFSTFGMEDGEVLDLDLGAWEDEPMGPYQAEPNRFRGLYSKVKIVMESCNYGARLLLDNVEMTAFADTQIKTLIEDEEVIGNQKYYSGLRPDARYYVGVKAKTDNFISDETLYEAWGIASPVGLPATEVTPTSYTAQWEATPNAAAYLLTTFDVVQLDKDANDYSHISENFNDVEVGTSDYDNPVKLGGFSEYFTLDDFTSVPGWYGTGVVAVDGQIGCAGCWYFPGMYGLITPPLSLGSNSGNYKLHLKMWGCEGSSIVVFSSTQSVKSEPFEDYGMQEITLEMTGGTYHDSLGFYTSDGQQFFIDEVEVLQDLSAGELIMTPVKEYEITDGSTSANIFHEAQPGMLRGYDIMAARIEFTRHTLSDYSAPVVVDSAVGIESVNENTNAFSVYASDGGIVVDTPMVCQIAIFSADGRCVVSEASKCGRNTFRLNSGVYIVRVGNKASKVVV